MNEQNQEIQLDTNALIQVLAKKNNDLNSQVIMLEAAVATLQKKLDDLAKPADESKEE